MTAFLGWCGQRARWFLIGGLLVGAFARPVAETFLPIVGMAIGGLLFLACFRTGPSAITGGGNDLRNTVLTALCLQIAVPLMVLWLGLALGVPEEFLAPIILLLAASSVTVVPHFLAIMGMETSHAVRLLLLGTLVLPITAWIVFSSATALGLAAYGDPDTIFSSTVRLLGVIAVAAGTAFALRFFAVPKLNETISHWVEGWAAILLAVVVIGLMAPIGSALTERPIALASTMVAAFAVNLTLQLSAWGVSGRLSSDRAKRATLAAVNGNRNFGLFLAALPMSVMEPMLLFIACYQVPNYLTPFIFQRLYAGGPVSTTS
ncbi:MAG: hypothetical protein AAFY73_08835 [Pseudomonadota bacterium]